MLVSRVTQSSGVELYLCSESSVLTVSILHCDKAREAFATQDRSEVAANRCPSSGPSTSGLFGSCGNGVRGRRARFSGDPILTEL